jgi:subtilase family serine protease
MESLIVVQATVAQVNQYLHASVSIYSNGTDSYYVTSGNSLFEGAHFVASNATALMVQPQVASLPAPNPNENLTFSEGAFSVKALQAVYNATSLYAQGYQGEGQTIGLLEFFGSPTVIQDLHLFDAQFGFSNPSLNIIPIVPYNPNLGVPSGWSTEVSLDVEVSHAMAPEAAIDMYVTTPAISFAADLAPIIEEDAVTTLSMSFITPEWYSSVIGGPLFYFNMFLPDQYFMLGSLEGITFLGASGDGGGSGYSSGPAGNLGGPASSPYVTAVGGTQTYFYVQNGTETFAQTAWSNLGYVNSGAGGGGVSFVEPKPWYQQSQQTPPSYPYGRMEPDLSLQAGVDPGIYMVDAGSVTVEGGTSVSVQLLSGLLTLVAESAGGPLGLINPFLYSLGNNAATYTEAFTPITFGYNIPWTSSFGYNLATGWGSPNIGEIASLYNAESSQYSLSVSVEVTNSTDASQLEFPLGEAPTETSFTPGQAVQVTASISMYNGAYFTPVTSGSFAASLVTVSGTSLVTPMSFDSTNEVWNASFIMGQQSGVAYVNVNGTSAGISGASFAEIFAGYIATFLTPTPTDPWTTASGLQVIVNSTDLYGNPAPLQPLTMLVNSYSILQNLYSTQGTVTLQPTSVSGINVTAATLTLTYPAGPIALVLQGSAYGFLPFTNGISLQSTFIVPEVIVEPGAVAPGQSLTIFGSPVAPLNVANVSSYETGATIGSDVASGSNVDAFLVDPSGNTVASTSLFFESSIMEMIGLLTVPSNAASGLYTILLQANYGSLTLGYTLYGAFYGQVLVSNGTITPMITLSPSTLYMGQTAQITADIRYPNCQEVTQGEYTAVIYPQELENEYSTIMYAEYLNFELTPLLYSPTLNRWVANVTLPSPYNSGVLSPVNDNSFYYAGPYEAYVTGLSYDGFPTTTALSAEQAFFIQPYVYLSNQQVTTFLQSWGLALSEVNVTGSVNLANDVFLGSNWFNSGTTVISDSVVNGTIFANGTSLTLEDVQGGNIVASNSSINLVNTDLNSITLVNSYLSLTSSSYQSISPSPPTIQISSPANGGNYTGDIGGNVTVSGNSISSVDVYLNYQLIQTFSNNGTLSFTIHSANYTDGGYSLLIVATQTDGISSSANLTVYFQNQLNTEVSSLQNQINGLGASLNATQTALQNQTSSLENSLNATQVALQNQINATQTALQNQINSLTDSLNRAYDYAYAGIGIGVAGVVIAAVAVFRKRSKGPPASTPEPVSSSETKEPEGEEPPKSGSQAGAGLVNVRPPCV